MNKLLWFLAFIFDVIVFSVVGIFATIWTIIETFVLVLVDLLLAIITWNGEEILNNIAKIPMIIFVVPVRSLRVVFERIKKSYNKPITLQAKEGK